MMLLARLIAKKDAEIAALKKEAQELHDKYGKLWDDHAELEKILGAANIEIDHSEADNLVLQEKVDKLKLELAECFEGATDLIHERMLVEEANRKLREDYNELIMAVGNKYLAEERHQTALRYIMEAEKGGGIAKTALEVKP